MLALALLALALAIVFFIDEVTDLLMPNAAHDEPEETTFLLLLDVAITGAGRPLLPLVWICWYLLFFIFMYGLRLLSDETADTPSELNDGFLYFSLHTTTQLPDASPTHGLDFGRATGRAPEEYPVAELDAEEV